MSDAPKRLWVVRRSVDSFEGWDSPEVYDTDEGAVEFVRADLFAARDARIRREERERCAQVAEDFDAHTVCLRCGAPANNHPYRHPFQPSRHGGIAAALRAMGDE